MNFPFFFSFLTLVYSEEHCSSLPNGIVLTKYYLDSCYACKKLSPVLEEIKNKAKEANISIKFREVECTNCECEDIVRFPTLEITEDKETRGQTIGYKDYDNLAKWISETLSLEGEVLGNYNGVYSAKSENIVKQLTARDFLGSFEGKWLILFNGDENYDKNGKFDENENKNKNENENDAIRDIFNKLAKTYGGKISIGVVSKVESQLIASKYNVTNFPSIIGINQNIPVLFTGEANFDELFQFALKLYTPAFKEIKYQELIEKSQELENGKPLYVVLYKNFEKASFYFNELAQQLKFTAEIYRSSDPEMFAAADRTPKDFAEFSGIPDDNQMAYLALFKNSKFFISPERIASTQNNLRWISETRFPYVTEIKKFNFNSIFNGTKPVMILLNESGNLDTEFARVGGIWNRGVASPNLVFTTLKPSEYYLFKNNFFKGINLPAIVFYDSIENKWYFKSSELTVDNLKESINSLTSLYFRKELPQFLQKPKGFSVYILASLSMMILGFLGKFLIPKKKRND